MPPKVKKGKKAKKVAEAEERQIEDREENTEDRDDNEGEGDEEDGSVKYEVFDKIVAFFEDRPYFHDVGDETYSNRKRKDAELAEFARGINWNPAAVMKRWRNWRTDYGKLRRWVGKSGQGARKKSILQQWKLRALSFLEPYILRRGSGSEMGRGEQDEAIEETGDLSSDEQPGPAAESSTQRGSSTDITHNRSHGLSAGCSTSSTISGKRKRIEKKTEKKKELGEILSQMLTDNRQKDKELVSKLDNEVYQQPSERDTFSAWLGSVVQQVPASRFRTFQREAFGLCLRYLDNVHPGESAPRHPLPAPRSQLNPLLAPNPVQQYTDSRPWLHPQYGHNQVPQSQDSLECQPSQPQGFMYLQSMPQPERRASSAPTTFNIVRDAYSVAQNTPEHENVSDTFSSSAFVPASTNSSLTREILQCQSSGERVEASTPMIQSSIWEDKQGDDNNV